MMYGDQELPTRPDLPSTAARKCKHCGKVYGDHVQGTVPLARATCGGLRRDFTPEDLSDGDHQR